MRKFFYMRLARRNIAANKRVYLPYLIAMALSQAMIYDLVFIGTHKGINSMRGAEALATLMIFGLIVMGLFISVVLFYTNSFLIKNRKKEIGLYNILGMSKHNIARMLSCESVISYFSTLAAGLLFGILISKLLLLVLVKLMRFDVPFGFEISIPAIAATVVLFAAISVLNLLWNLANVRLSNPVELLHGGSQGEKEPKTKWALTVAGVIFLGLGYTMAVAAKTATAALMLFFIAVTCVIIGTYLLFIAGSVAVLKALKKNKKYYYKSKHFTSVSGMIYRMKQNAAGLATICILSTMVLVTVSTTVSLYSGISAIVDTRYPADLCVIAPIDGGASPDEALEQIAEISASKAEQSGQKFENTLGYSSLSFAMLRDGSSFKVARNNFFSDDVNACQMVVFTRSQFLKIGGELPNAKNDTVFVRGGRDQYKWTSITLNGRTYSAEWLDSIPKNGRLSVLVTETFYIVVPDDGTLAQLDAEQRAEYGDDASVTKAYFYFDTDGTAEQQMALADTIKASLHEFKGVSVESRASSEPGFYSLYGGFLFIGVFFELMFISATALIIYYKQVTEGLDDRSRFEIMQKVGMTGAEVRRSVNSQILTVFFLPLAAAIVHLAFSFPLTSKMLTLFGLTDTSIFVVGCLITAVVFAAVYAAIYAATARTYYKIVRS